MKRWKQVDDTLGSMLRERKSLVVTGEDGEVRRGEDGENKSNAKKRKRPLVIYG